MAPDHLRRIIPQVPAEATLFQVYQITHQFYEEVRQREELERYSRWYEATAQAHQQELSRMQRDINLLGWFYRGRRR